jgi:hypothetical protein
MHCPIVGYIAKLSRIYGWLLTLACVAAAGAARPGAAIAMPMASTCKALWYFETKSSAADRRATGSRR